MDRFFGVFLGLFERERETEEKAIKGWTERERKSRERTPSRLRGVSTESRTELELMNHEILT